MLLFTRGSVSSPVLSASLELESSLQAEMLAVPLREMERKREEGRILTMGKGVMVKI